MLGTDWMMPPAVAEQTWGGVGTLMETDLKEWTVKFAPIIRDPGSGLL
jgi:hypothetical protein